MKPIRLRSDFEYTFKWVKGYLRLGIIIDNNLEGKISVTNDIENIAEVLNVSNIIYMDSEKVWSFWSKTEGFQSLQIKDNLLRVIEPPTLDIAIEIAKNRYIKTI